MEGLRGYSTAIIAGFAVVALGVLGARWQALSERADAATPAALYSYAPPQRDAGHSNRRGAGTGHSAAAADNKGRGVSPSKPPARPAPAEVTRPKTSKPAGKQLPALRSIELNRATQAQLELLPGIGPALASRIVSYRNEHGAFKSVAELDNVKGIGPKKLEALAPYCYVE